MNLLSRASHEVTSMMATFLHGLHYPKQYPDDPNPDVARPEDVMAQQSQTLTAMRLLLSIPDEPSLKGRGHRVTQLGRPDNDAQMLRLVKQWVRFRRNGVQPETNVAEALLVARTHLDQARRA